MTRQEIVPMDMIFPHVLLLSKQMGSPVGLPICLLKMAVDR